MDKNISPPSEPIDSMSQDKPTPSIIGGACIIASVCLGAGMLGLPSAGAGAWTLWSIFVVALTMLVMTVSGWMLLEVFKHYDYKVSFNTVTKDLLGAKVNAFNNFTVYFVGGILLYAYITSYGLILEDLLNVPDKVAAVIFVLLFSSVVWHSTRAVDRISVLLILVMVFTFIFGILGLFSNLNIATLFDTVANQAAGESSSYAPFALAMLPVALTSFGYHHSVSSMRDYYHSEQKAKYAILGGTVIALLLYTLWMVSIFGNLPRSNFGEVIAQGGNVDALLQALSGVIASERVHNILNAFSMAAILSSFIGVGLGVFDYLADFFQFDDTPKGRAKSWAVTFIPPLVCSLLFPFGFVTAIGYAGAAATVWACIIPALLVYKVRQKHTDRGGFKVKGGKGLIYFVVAFGVITAVVHFASMLNLLPVFNEICGILHP